MKQYIRELLSNPNNPICKWCDQRMIHVSKESGGYFGKKSNKHDCFKCLNNKCNKIVNIHEKHHRQFNSLTIKRFDELHSNVIDKDNLIFEATMYRSSKKPEQDAI